MTSLKGLGRPQVEIPAVLEPVDSYLAEVVTGMYPLPAEEVPLGAALRRVLAHDVTAGRPLPSFCNSAMDGYAVRSGDVGKATPDRPAILPVVGGGFAGSVGQTTVGEGTAVRIMTGAPVPPGANAIVPVEVTTEEGTSVSIHRTPT